MLLDFVSQYSAQNFCIIVYGILVCNFLLEARFWEFSVSPRSSNLLAYNSSECSHNPLYFCKIGNNVNSISSFSYLGVFSLVTLAKGLSILIFGFTAFSLLFFYSLFISVLILIFFLLLVLGLVHSSFPSSLKFEVRLLTWDLSFFNITCTAVISLLALFSLHPMCLICFYFHPPLSILSFSCEFFFDPLAT